jgi:mannitol-1-phosphate 5-dehydrogenase
MPDTIVVFGAGATGRGHVGLLAWQAGFQIVFVDKDADLCRTLKEAGCYRVKLYGQAPHEVEVSGYRIYHHQQRDAIAAEIADASLVLTAVFDQNLPDVAITLARAVTACRRKGRGQPLNCLACENMMNSSTTLGRHIRSHLDAEDQAYCERFWGFPDCMISRVVPRPEPDPLVIVTEDYNEWTTRREHFKGARPAGLTALEPVDNQTARLERKLLIHNGGHAICGYAAFHRGHEFVHEALQDAVVVEHVLCALDEIGDVVKRKHGFSAESINEYKADLGRRGAIAELRDPILRVVRDPIRKLSARERLVAPAMLAVEFGLPREWIVKGIVAAMKYHHPGDPQSEQLAAWLSRDGVHGVLRSVCSIDEQCLLVDEITGAWDRWQTDTQ